MSTELGFEEGSVCNRDGCTGHIVTRRSENCSCHLSAPCSSCTAPRNYCDECEWEEADEPEPEVTQAEKNVWAAFVREQERIANLPLDNTKISWRSRPHSSCSMIKEGVYPEGTTVAEVRKLVDGTFGGRFDHFGNGRFRFIAYTD
jgi:hypothetical protein